MGSSYSIVPLSLHDQIIIQNFQKRGYDLDEASAVARIGGMASWHGIRTHNSIKAVSIDDHIGSKVGGYQPGAKLERLEPKFRATERWNGNRKCGPAVAFAAMARAMELANEYGVGFVSVDNASHYLWGGGYVLDAASKGFIAYTGCTSAASEVVPYGGKTATLGTNPHSWAFPTKNSIGFDIVIDWATSSVAWGRVQQFAREGKKLPEGIALDRDGKFTTDPNQTVALTAFGAHKGYGLALIDELWAAYVGGSLPSIRGKRKKGEAGEKHGSVFVFQCIHPDALDCGNFAFGNSQSGNLKRILEDIRSHGNENCLYPGQPEAEAAKLSARYDGLLFTKAEIDELEKIAQEAGVPFSRESLRTVEIS